MSLLLPLTFSKIIFLLPPLSATSYVHILTLSACAFSFLTVQVRVNSLVCLGKILEYLDKWFVIDEILPFLQQIPSREPAVLMGILGNWALKHFSSVWVYLVIHYSASPFSYFRNL